MSENTPEESTFTVLCSDQVREWSPQTACRTVLYMRAVTEWEPDEGRRIEELERLLDNCRSFDGNQNHVRETVGYGEVYPYPAV